MNILLVQFLTESLELLLLLYQLSLKTLDSLLQLSSVQRTAFQFLLKLCNQLFVLFHLSSDELYIFFHLLLTACTLSALSQSNTSLSLANLAKTFLNLIEGTHHVINLTISLSNYLIERICKMHISRFWTVFSILTTSY